MNPACCYSHWDALCLQPGTMVRTSLAIVSHSSSLEKPQVGSNAMGDGIEPQSHACMDGRQHLWEPFWNGSQGLAGIFRSAWHISPMTLGPNAADVVCAREVSCPNSCRPLTRTVPPSSVFAVKVFLKTVSNSDHL